MKLGQFAEGSGTRDIPCRIFERQSARFEAGFGIDRKHQLEFRVSLEFDAVFSHVTFFTLNERKIIGFK